MFTFNYVLVLCGLLFHSEYVYTYRIGREVKAHNMYLIGIFFSIQTAAAAAAADVFLCLADTGLGFLQ